MGNYPFSRSGALIETDGKLVEVDRAFVGHIFYPAVPLGATTAVKTAVTDTGAQQVITTGLTSPTIPRNITATAGGTATDIKAIQVIVEGTNVNGDVITETLPAFTVNTAGTVVGNKAFMTVTKITIPAHDGTGATTAIGTGAKLAIPFKLAHNTVIRAVFDNTVEATAPTVAVSATEVESNTFTLNTALNAKDVDVYLFV
jgi:hypothetical protein